jgi:hypothetical protein
MHLAPLAKAESNIRIAVNGRPVGVVTCPNCLVAVPRISLKGGLKIQRCARPHITDRGATPKLD